MEMNTELLGAAEQHVIKQLIELIGDCKKNLTLLMEEFDKIDESRFPDMMLDTKNKETLIACITPFSNQRDNLSRAALLPMILAIITKPKEN